MQMRKWCLRVRIVDRDVPLQCRLDDSRKRNPVRSVRERLLPDFFWRLPCLRPFVRVLLRTKRDLPHLSIRPPTRLE